jgi:ElaB/YqjD/DUF883 family membrane-anchored ribosome-binding protein
METTVKADGIGDANGAVARTVDQAATGAHKAIDKASDAARPAVDRLASGAHHAVDKIAGVASDAAETLDLKSEQLMDAQSRLTENCREYVRDNPVTSLGIAVAAGFLLSRLLSSR